jgi:subtilase family serine protease
VKFEKVKKLQDPSNHPYWIFNLNATITNLGKADAKRFRVLIDRNIGLNGSFQLACQTCWIDVPGLRAGDSIALDPRQFNNANNFPSTFRVKADYPDNVRESNEMNNMATAAFVNFTMEGTR